MKYKFFLGTNISNNLEELILESSVSVDNSLIDSINDIYDLLDNNLS